MFQGFTPETIDFLWGIRLNNNRDWFLAHKDQYVDTLYGPMKELGKDLFQPFLDKPGNVLKVSRIYRDARLHHPLPYKESLWICIRRDVDWWAENPCLYFEINPDQVHYGFFYWQPPTAKIADFRSKIAAKPDEFLELIERTSAIQPITAECYKRPPQPNDPRLAPYFAWRRQIGCVREEAPSPALFGPQLGDRVSAFFQELMPLYDFFNQFST